MELKTKILGIILLILLIFILFKMFNSRVCPSPETCPTIPPATECPTCLTVPPATECPTCPTVPPATECPTCPTVPPATECPTCPKVLPVPCPPVPPATECPTRHECILLHPVETGNRQEEYEKELYKKFPEYVDFRDYTIEQDENGEWGVENLNKKDWCTYNYYNVQDKDMNLQNAWYVKPAKNHYIARLTGDRFTASSNICKYDVPRNMSVCTRDMQPVCGLVFLKHKEMDRDGNEVIRNVFLEKDFNNPCEAEAHGAIEWFNNKCTDNTCNHWDYRNYQELISTSK